MNRQQRAWWGITAASTFPQWKLKMLMEPFVLQHDPGAYLDTLNPLQGVAKTIAENNNL